MCTLRGWAYGGIWWPGLCVCVWGGVALGKGRGGWAGGTLEMAKDLPKTRAGFREVEALGAMCGNKDSEWLEKQNGVR